MGTHRYTKQRRAVFVLHDNPLKNKINWFLAKIIGQILIKSNCYSNEKIT